MLRVGIVGIGFMGWIHWLAYQRASGIGVSCLCSRDPAKRSGDWRNIRGNFGPPGEQVDLTGIRACSELSELLESADLDCVDICLPPDQHVSAAVAAAEAGKHVFCEKPLALDAAGCDRILDACRQNGVQLIVGQVLPYFPEYAWAREQISSGKYGKLLGGTFKRVISNPDWIPDFYDPARVGGPLVDLHVHDAHLIRLLFGMPRGLFCRGRFRGETVAYAHTVYDFADPQVVVSSVMGVTNQPGRPFTHGFEIHLEEATLQFEFACFADQGESMPVKLIDRAGQVLRPPLAPFDPVDGFVAEIHEVRDAILGNRPSPLLSGALARDAILRCQEQARSARLNQYVQVAP
ncbi:MAG: Gfo/Idh/MocA family protein [Planctomycetota bacterium]